MLAASHARRAHPSVSANRERGALGIFQLLGLGLLLLFVVFVLIVVVRGLFT